MRHKLNEIYTNKAKGWIEGEQNSAYFFSLEKYHGKANAIQQVNIDGTGTDDRKIIADYCSKFYDNLYKSKYCQLSTTLFLNSLNVAQINRDDMKLCDESVTVQEVRYAIEHLRIN